MRYSWGMCLSLTFVLSCAKPEPGGPAFAIQTFSACWLDEGNVRCWGTESTPRSATPIAIDNGSTWSTIESGMFSYCATTTSGELWCWGRIRDAGETLIDSATPVQLAPEGKWKRVIPSFGHLCGLQTDGSLWCWGRNVFGQVGDGSVIHRKEPVRIGQDTWTDIAVGNDHVCGVKSDHTLWCWGANEDGELGDGSFQPRHQPTQVEGSGWKSVSVSWKSFYSCGLKDDGSAWCWGSGDWGKLAGAPKSPVPVRIPYVPAFESLRVAWGAACGVSAAGEIWCWGTFFEQSANLSNQSQLREQSMPVKVSTESDWISAIMELGFMCAMKRDHSLWCWGENVTGQIGNGSGKYEAEPVRVVPAD